MHYHHMSYDIITFYEMIEKVAFGYCIKLMDVVLIGPAIENKAIVS